MNYGLFAVTGSGLRLMKDGFPAGHEAVAHANAHWDILHIEHDDENPGCFDMITAGGTQFAVEPVRKGIGSAI